MADWTLEKIEALDATDPLAAMRDRFHIPDGVIYLDGNSLGALPRATPDIVDNLIRRQWGDDLIRSWNTHGWIDMPGRVGDGIARLIGVGTGEVVAADSTSVNLFKLVIAALRLRPGRRRILTEEGNFPTDLYVMQGIQDLLGDAVSLEAVPAADIAGAMGEDVAVLALTHVNYRTGAFHDMAAVTAMAHDAGALVVWDLSHSAGALPIDLNAADADFAVGCGYKYLNGGPGAPAFLFVAERHQNVVQPPLSGWMGHASPFDFDSQYRPAPGIGRNLCGTPAIIGLAALEAGIATFDGVDMVVAREKSVALGDLFLGLMEDKCGSFGFQLACPRDGVQRGSQVSFSHAESYAIMQALIAKGVIGDFRAPDILRFGLTPLYLRYRDVWQAVEILARIMADEAWADPAFQARNAVT